MKSKSFKNWKIQDLHDTFAIERIYELDVYDNWLKSTEILTEDEKEQLEILRLYATINIDYWNEEELKMNFIGSILRLANLSGKNYRTFYDRPVSAIMDNTKLFGRLDGVVANGFQEPKTPYFCIHEYKQENNREGDPKGQLLAAMLAVQTLNQNNRPIFGCSVLARNWYFMVLDKKKYAVSDAYVSTNQDNLFQIFRMLRFVKTYIEAIHA
jgi:hypothetical protein